MEQFLKCSNDRLSFRAAVRAVLRALMSGSHFIICIVLYLLFISKQRLIDSVINGMGVVGRGGALDMGPAPLETSSGSAPAEYYILQFILFAVCRCVVGLVASKLTTT